MGIILILKCPLSAGPAKMDGMRSLCQDGSGQGGKRPGEGRVRWGMLGLL